jgi:ketosteroid isomerase-like protein
MNNAAKQVVTDFLTAVQHGNMEKLSTLISQDVQWVQPGNNVVSGVKKSSGEVFQMVGKMFELSGNTLKLTEIKSITVNGNKVACLLNWSATKSFDVTLNVDNIDVYTVDNGQIIRVEVFTTDLDQENHFWSN